MSGLLEDEIKQQTPFASVREALFLNLARTAAAVAHRMDHTLRPYGLSSTQYNVLRILRGAGPAGLPQHEIRDRLVARVPDVPRILERMERAEWIVRARGSADRRVVLATLSSTGRELVDKLDDPVEASTGALFPGLSDGDLHTLNDLLEAARKDLTCPESEGCGEESAAASACESDPCESDASEADGGGNADPEAAACTMITRSEAEGYLG